MLALFLAASLLTPYAHGHGQMSNPTPRHDFVGREISWQHRAPVYLLQGPREEWSPSSFRCHDFDDPSPLTTVRAGEEMVVEWYFEANHPGDCFLYISYDDDKTAPENWIKIHEFVGCGDLTSGGIIPKTTQKHVITLPPELPPCDHCVLRWEWYAVQQVKNVEFYVTCSDIKILSDAPPGRPTPTVSITGIDHLSTNADDYRAAYHYEIGEEYLVGPEIWQRQFVTIPPTAPTVPDTPAPTTDAGYLPREECPFVGDMSITSEWNDGFNLNVELTAQQAVSEFALLLKFGNGETLSSSWNCVISGTDPATGAIRLVEANYHGLFSVGDKVNCGMQGAKSVGKKLLGGNTMFTIQGCQETSIRHPGDNSPPTPAPTRANTPAPTDPTTPAPTEPGVGQMECSGNGVLQSGVKKQCAQQCECYEGYFGNECETTNPPTGSITITITGANFVDCDVQNAYIDAIKAAAPLANPGAFARPSKISKKKLIMVSNTYN